MDIRRTVLYMALALVGLSLWNAWQIDYPVKQPITENVNNQSTGEGHLLPQVTPEDNKQANPNPEQAVVNSSNPSQLVHVKTDVLDVNIDLRQGDIVTGLLLDYPLSVDDKNKPFPLLQNQSNERYVANSSIFVSSGQTVQSLDFGFKTNQQEYQLNPDQNQLTVTLDGSDAD